MSGRCGRVISALQDCQKKHRRDPDFFCSHLTAAAGWCIFAGLCPEEVRAIEDCIGIGSSAGRAPVIPKRCQDRAALLEACIESKQAIAEARTERCSGPRPVGAPAGAAATAAAGGADGAGGGGSGSGEQQQPAKRRGRPPQARARSAAEEGDAPAGAGSSGGA